MWTISFSNITNILRVSANIYEGDIIYYLHEPY